MPEISLPSYSPFLKFLVICESPLSLAVPTHSILVAPKAMEDVLRIAIVSNENAYLEGGGKFVYLKVIIANGIFND